MARVTAARSVRQAERELMRMDYQGEGFESHREAGRRAF